MYPKDRHLMWVLLVTVGHLLVRGGCDALEHPAVPSGRKLAQGHMPMHHNHLLLLHNPGTSGESVKFSANNVQHVPPSFPAAWRTSATISPTLASGWLGSRKPLARPSHSGVSRSRINNRSMTRFSEVEIPAGMQRPPLDVDVSNPIDRVDHGLVELYRSAERSRGVENFFWKYFVDGDVSASTEDSDVDGAEEALGGTINKNVDSAGNALQLDGDEGNGTTKEEEARKKKFHLKKKYKKFLIPLLLAYKIKFLALVPAIIGGLILLVKAAGLAGFFFALFTAVVSLKKY